MDLEAIEVEEDQGALEEDKEALEEDKALEAVADSKVLVVEEAKGSAEVDQVDLADNPEEEVLVAKEEDLVVNEADLAVNPAEEDLVAREVLADHKEALEVKEETEVVEEDFEADREGRIGRKIS
uniref:Uncharacterized protein n=1 Tax=Cacopsylla melanoneura TaxID=428564 RepID=A0A8D9F681_9HEMI